MRLALGYSASKQLNWDFHPHSQACFLSTTALCKGRGHPYLPLVASVCMWGGGTEGGNQSGRCKSC